MASWALGLAIVPCLGITPFVAIALAITVLVRSQSGLDRGKGRAIAALVIAPLWIITIVGAAILGAFHTVNEDADRDSTGQIASRDQVSVMKLRVGDCFDYPDLASGKPDAVSMSVAAVPCAQSHQFEAYATFDLTGDEFPGQDRMDVQAVAGCFPRFREFVGVPYGKSRLEVYFFFPTATTWRVLDDRAVLCLVGDPKHTTTGTLGGTRR